MMDIPESTKAMIADEALHDGVSELVAKLNGKKMIADNWDQSRDYARALGMAALARSDYVVLMHDLWDATWGKAGALELGAPEDDEPCDPHTIWDNWEIIRYVDFKKPIGTCSHASFAVIFDIEEGVMLDVHFNDADYAEVENCAALAEDLTHWHSQDHDNFEHAFLRSITVPTKSLDTVSETLRKAAEEIIALAKAGKI